MLIRIEERRGGRGAEPRVRRPDLAAPHVTIYPDRWRPRDQYSAAGVPRKTLVFPIPGVIVAGLMVQQLDPMAALHGLSEAITGRLAEMETSRSIQARNQRKAQIRAKVDHFPGPIVRLLSRFGTGISVHAMSSCFVLCASLLGPSGVGGRYSFCSAGIA